MKKTIFYQLFCVILFLIAILGYHVWHLYEVVKYFQNQGDIVLTYPNGLCYYIEFKGQLTNKDVKKLNSYKPWLYPLTILYFNGVEYHNTIPISKISSLQSLTIIGSKGLQSYIDEFSLENLLNTTNIESITFVETQLPKQFLKQSRKYQFKKLWLDDILITDAEFDRLFYLYKTESLFLARLPLGKQTLKKIYKEGASLKETKFIDLQFTEEDFSTEISTGIDQTPYNN